MKKIIMAVSSAIVAGAMLFAFVGCDNETADNDKTKGDVSNNAAVTVEAESNT